MSHALTDALPFRDPRDRLVVALDVSSLDAACGIADRLHGLVRWFKVGPQLFLGAGPQAVVRLRERGRVFLDMKFHDIPATVAAAVGAATDLGCDLINVHALGGRAMLEAARDAAVGAATAAHRRMPAVIAVTILTSGDAAAMQAVGSGETPAEGTLRLAWLARAAGLAGVVASPLDAAAIRAACGPAFLIVCPGIRPAGAGRDDQRRVQTPHAAVASGADLLVVGRPITGAPDPRRAAEEILREIAV